MTGPSARAVAAVVRMWTRLYTWRLPDDLRARRIEEVESDLWESQRAGTAAAPQILARLVLGVPDDLGWRIDVERAMKRTIFSTMSVAAVLIALVLLVQIVAVLSASPPPAPDSPGVIKAKRAAVRPPPPPPPPPPRPASDEISPVRHSVTVFRVLGAGESPRLAKGVSSPYWPVEADFRMEDSVLIRGIVQPDGTVTRLQIVQSIPEFDRRALTIARRWSYTPTTVNEQPVATTVELMVQIYR